MTNPVQACFVCGRGDVELRVRWFEILWSRITGEVICETCCKLSLNPECGEEAEAWDVTEPV